MKTIQQLRQEKYKVRVMHFRYLGDFKSILPRREINGKWDIINPFGGKTIIEITTPDGKDIRGEAFCSKKDQFNRKIANQIALGRALAQL